MNLFIGLPTYGAFRANTVSLLAMVQNQKYFEKVHFMEVESSLLAAGFNRLLINALKLRDKGEADFFLLMHADVVPIDLQTWLDDLMKARQFARQQQMDKEKNKAAVVSVVVPIKDERGLTSTAVEGPTVWNPRRLTMHEIMNGPETFTRDDLLVNTAMLLIDLRNSEWLDHVSFTIRDAILVGQNGQRFAGSQPEDWDFSRQARAAGIKLWATRKVRLVHRGGFNYPNFASWGAEADEGDKAP